MRIYTVRKCLLTSAVLASDTRGHVMEDVLHRLAVRQGTGLGAVLLTLALVCVKEEDKLLLNQLPLLGVRRWRLVVRGI